MVVVVIQNGKQVDTIILKFELRSVIFITFGLI